MPGRSIEEIVGAYLDNWKASDIGGLRSMYAPDVKYHDLTSGAIIGFDDIEPFLRNTFDMEPDSDFTFNNIVYPNDESAFIHWTQNLSVPGRKRNVDVAGVELIVVRDCKIVSIHEFYDYRLPDPKPEEEDKSSVQAEQLRKLGLDEDRMLEIKENVQRFFEIGEPYLDPDINLVGVAEQLHVTRNQLSFVINNMLSCSFYDLVNQHRITYVQDVIKSADSKFSVVTVALEAGFNSISGFYSAFKKATGMTPTAYSKLHAKN